MKWIGWLAAITLTIACFLPWVSIPWIGFAATGVNAGPEFRSPAYAHFFFILLYIIFSLVPKVWAKRANLLVVALNMGWAMRNFLLITACGGGECPVKEIGIWLVLVCSLLVLVSALFPDVKIADKR